MDRSDLSPIEIILKKDNPDLLENAHKRVASVQRPRPVTVTQDSIQVPFQNKDGKEVLMPVPVHLINKLQKLQQAASPRNVALIARHSRLPAVLEPS